MSNSAKETALQVLHESSIGVMATNNNGVPNSRYMTFSYIEAQLYTVAKQDSSVVQELKANPNTHILLGYEGDGLTDTFLEIEGHAVVTINDLVKQQLLEKYPAASMDDLVVLQVTPTNMRIMNKNGKNQEDVHLN